MRDLTSLVTEAAAEDASVERRAAAFGEIVKRLQDMAVGYAYTRLGDFQLAEDAAQHAFVEAWRTLHGLREHGAFAAWLRRLVVGACGRLTRGKRVLTTTLDDARSIPSDSPTPHDLAETRETRSRVLAEVRLLPERERVTTTLYYIGGYTQAEVADFLAVPLGTVKYRLHSARKKLREGLMDMVRDSLSDNAPSRDSGFAARVARLTQPEAMKTTQYQYGVEPVDGGDAWELMKACAAGNIGDVRAYVERDAKLVNAQYWYQFPVNFAVREGHAEVTQYLLDNGADPGRSRYLARSWQSLVQEATRRGYRDVLRVVEAALAERYAYDPDFEPLAQAIRDRDLAAIEAIVSERPGLAKASDVLGQSALHWAGLTHQPKLIDYFLDRGAAIDRPRADGQTPAMLTMNGDYHYRRHRDLPKGVSKNWWPTVDRFLERGAEYNLSIATMKCDTDRIEALLEADPDQARELDSGRVGYLYYAACVKRADIAEMFLALGADPNAPQRLGERGRALHEACGKGDPKMVRLLLEHGADPNAEVDSSGSCLHIVTAHGRGGARRERVLKLLRKFGAVAAPYDMTRDELMAWLDEDDGRFSDEQLLRELCERADAGLARAIVAQRPDALGLLPVYGARYPKSTECLQALLDHGVDPNLGDWFGKTWLHFMAENGDVELAELLVDAGADVNALEAEHRRTPLAEAAKQGHVDVTRLLLDRGARPDLPDEDWARPLAWALEGGHDEVAALLRDATAA